MERSQKQQKMNMENLIDSLLLSCRWRWVLYTEIGESNALRRVWELIQWYGERDSVYIPALNYNTGEDDQTRDFSNFLFLFPEK